MRRGRATGMGSLTLAQNSCSGGVTGGQHTLKVVCRLGSRL